MSEIICVKCNAALVKVQSKFSYLGHEFQSEVPGCPVCGRIYLSEKLVDERIRQIEAAVEDK
jgi:uncharacterized protein with PIN domain